MNSALLSSKKMDWCTPQDFFDHLNEEFGFVLDAAATDKTAKCPLYYTPETDGLSQSWDPRRRGFLQPALWTRDRKVGKEGIRRSTRGGVRYCTAYSRSNGYSLFSRLHIRESRNPLRSRAASLHRRRRERQRSRALPFYGSYL